MIHDGFASVYNDDFRKLHVSVGTTVFRRLDHAKHKSKHNHIRRFDAKSEEESRYEASKKTPDNEFGRGGNNVHTCRNIAVSVIRSTTYNPAKRILSRASHWRLLSQSPVTDSTGCSIERYGKHATNDTPSLKVERREINNEIFDRIINTKFANAGNAAHWSRRFSMQKSNRFERPKHGPRGVREHRRRRTPVMDAWTKLPCVRWGVVFRFSNKNLHYLNLTLEQQRYRGLLIHVVCVSLR